MKSACCYRLAFTKSLISSKIDVSVRPGLFCITENKIKSKEKYNKIKQTLVGVGVESFVNQRGKIQNTHKQNEKISLAKIVKMIW